MEGYLCDKTRRPYQEAAESTGQPKGCREQQQGYADEIIEFLTKRRGADCRIVVLNFANMQKPPKKNYSNQSYWSAVFRLFKRKLRRCCEEFPDELIVEYSFPSVRFGFGFLIKQSAIYRPLGLCAFHNGSLTCNHLVVSAIDDRRFQIFERAGKFECGSAFEPGFQTRLPKNRDTEVLRPPELTISTGKNDLIQPLYTQ